MSTDDVYKLNELSTAAYNTAARIKATLGLFFTLRLSLAVRGFERF
jgi:hypothetical protein